MVTNRLLFLGIFWATIVAVCSATVLVWIGIGLEPFPVSEEVRGMVVATVPMALSSYWLYRRLKTQGSQQEARTAAVAFAITGPVGFVAALILGQLTGGYAAYLGRPFGLIGALTGVVLLMSAICFLSCVAAVSIARRLRSK